MSIMIIPVLFAGSLVVLCWRRIPAAERKFRWKIILLTVAALLLAAMWP